MVPGPPKNHQKIGKIVFGTVLEPVWDPVSILDTILDRYGCILGGFGEDFEWILEGFWQNFVPGFAELLILCFGRGIVGVRSSRSTWSELGRGKCPHRLPNIETR